MLFLKLYTICAIFFVAKRSIPGNDATCEKRGCSSWGDGRSPGVNICWGTMLGQLDFWSIIGCGSKWKTINGTTDGNV